MHSILTPVFNKTRFEFSFLAGTTSQVVTMAPAIDLIPHHTLYLLVRVHRISVAAGGSFSLTLYNTLPSEEDPQEFTEIGTPIIIASIPAGTTAPSLISSSATTPPAFGKLVLTANQGSVGGLSLYAELSACLLGRAN